VYPKNGYRNLGDGIIGPAMGTTGVGDKKSMVADLVSPSDAVAFMPTVKVNAAYAMTEDDQLVFADATTGGFAVTPPPLTATNKTFTVKKPVTDVSSNAVAIAGLEGGTISLATPGASLSFVSDGAAFNITAKV